MYTFFHGNGDFAPRRPDVRRSYVRMWPASVQLRATLRKRRETYFSEPSPPGRFNITLSLIKPVNNACHHFYHLHYCRPSIRIKVEECNQPLCVNIISLLVKLVNNDCHYLYHLYYYRLNIRIKVGECAIKSAPGCVNIMPLLVKSVNNNCHYFYYLHCYRLTNLNKGRGVCN